MYVVLAKFKSHTGVIGPFTSSATAQDVADKSAQLHPTVPFVVSCCQEVAKWNGECWENAPGQIAHRVAKWKSVQKAR